MDLRIIRGSLPCSSAVQFGEVVTQSEDKPEGLRDLSTYFSWRLDRGFVGRFRHPGWNGCAVPAGALRVTFGQP